MVDVSFIRFIETRRLLLIYVNPPVVIHFDLSRMASSTTMRITVLTITALGNPRDPMRIIMSSTALHI